MASDIANVIVTNDDATIGKNSAVQMGYYVDPYIPIFVKASIAMTSASTNSFGPTEISLSQAPGGIKSTGWAVNELPSASRSAHHIMPPLINRGYHARVQAIRASLKHFVSNFGGSQIVSLGAGFDTTYFLLRDEGFNMDKYIEIDMSDTVMKKASAVRSKKNLFEKHLPNLTFKRNGDISSDIYSLVSCDLRDVSALDRVITECGLDKARPTLFLSECVLIYMTPEESGAVISWASEKFQQSYFVLYEQVEPHDNFGKAMLENLKARQCPLLSILKYPTLADQETRFLSLGWDYVEVWNMDSVYRGVVAREPEENRRLNALEFLDELEEWDLFNQHYFIALASHHAHFASKPNEQDSSCRTSWKMQFTDLHVPVGLPPASSAKRAVPAWMLKDLS